MQSLQAANPSPSARNEIPEVLLYLYYSQNLMKFESIFLMLFSNVWIMLCRIFSLQVIPHSFQQLVDGRRICLTEQVTACNSILMQWYECHISTKKLILDKNINLKYEHVSCQQSLAAYPNSPKPKNPFDFDDDRFQVQAATVSINGLFSFTNLT